MLISLDFVCLKSLNFITLILCINEPSAFLLQTMRFCICLAVRSVVGVPSSNFSFQPFLTLERHGVDVAQDDILQYYIAKDEQLMNEKTPWRGPREKATLLM